MDTSNQMNPELLQIQSRLLNLTNQIDLIHTNIDRLTTDMQASGVQIDGLTRNLTHPDANQQIADNWSEIFIRLEEYQDKMDGLLSIARQSAGSQQLTDLSQALLDTNGQVSQNQEQLAELAKSLKKLTRTQFKANTLVESKDQHLNSAFSTLQDMATRREEATENHSQQATEQTNQLRKDARAELVAEMLPAIDSLERALASGDSLSQRQKQEVENYLQNTTVTVPVASAMPVLASKKSTWGRLVSALVNAEGPVPQPLLPSVSEIESAVLAEQAERHADNLSQMTASADAWLDGLHLVRERFLSVLATENVEPIPALGELFDPRLHVAVSTENREDVPNNTIVDVLRTGYYQDGRILRYAEVSVARNEPVAEPVPPINEPSLPDGDEQGDSDEIVGVVGGAVAVGAAAAAMDTIFSDNDDLEEIAVGETEIEAEIVEIEVEIEPEIEMDLEELPAVDLPPALDEQPTIDIEPAAALSDINLPDTDSADENLDIPAVENEPTLSPEQMPDYEPAAYRAYVDEDAAERASIVNYMLGKPTEPVETIHTNGDSIDGSVPPMSSVFDTDEQVSMSREMDEETFASPSTTAAVMNSGGPDYGMNAQKTASSIGHNVDATPYPDKTNVQSDISWVQYESPKRKSWISRLFGTS